MTAATGATQVAGAARAAVEVARADRIVVLTGAGMSAESGIPTFRDALTGLWAQYSPDELATPQAFLADPPRVFGWYLQRWRAVRDVQPHAGHLALASLQRWAASFVVITQNIDRLHQRAGIADVIELHGALEAFRCWERGHPFDVTALAARDGDAPVDPPHCSVCGSVVRPGVVWFGEMLPVEAMRRAERLLAECDLLLVIGTSGLVYPAAGLPLVARRAGAVVVEVNPEPTPITPLADAVLREPAGSALAAIVERLEHGPSHV
ncbi:MAG TPA: NAD-dependent deacylase [Gemmatimonadales bacterium]|jgi:NAD-dependent deacetylase